MRAVAAVTAAMSVLFACSSPNEGARVDVNVGDKATFLPVASALGRRCGSIDCHGSAYRNFRVYGYGGLRLAPGDLPDKPDKTTQAESDATYEGFVSLEPELTRQVLLTHGVGVDDLTVIRKGRGDEEHKGGRLIIRNDDADLCVLGWIRAAPDPDACGRVLTAP